MPDNTGPGGGVSGIEQGEDAEWGEECATCGVNRRREADLFCSDECAGNDWLNQPDGREQYDTLEFWDA
jgi:hypothetical protein